MKRLVVVLGTVAAIMLVHAPAQTASPKAGTLLRTKRLLTYRGGPFLLSQPNYLADDCLGGRSDPTCDHFALTVMLGEGAQIEVRITTANPNPETGAQPLDGDDYDVFVYSPGGRLVTKAANTRGNETVRFQHHARDSGKPYEVRVAPWFVMPGSSYKGTIRAITVGS